MAGASSDPGPGMHTSRSETVSCLPASRLSLSSLVTGRSRFAICTAGPVWAPILLWPACLLFLGSRDEINFLSLRSSFVPSLQGKRGDIFQGEVEKPVIGTKSAPLASAHIFLKPSVSKPLMVRKADGAVDGAARMHNLAFQRGHVAGVVIFVAGVATFA